MAFPKQLNKNQKTDSWNLTYVKTRNPSFLILSHIKKNENLAKDRGNTAKQQQFPVEKE